MDFCVQTSTLEVLFNQVYDTYKRKQHQLFYFDALEPYILSHQVPRLPWWVLKDFLDVFARNQRVASLERCLLHLELERHEDVDMVALFCLQRGRYSGFLQAYVYGTHDLAGTLMILLERLLAEVSTPGVAKNAYCWST